MLQIAAILDQAIHVYRDHVDRSGTDTARPQAIGEAVIRNLIPQTAARSQGVCTWRLINEEAVALTELFGAHHSEITISCLLAVSQHRSSDDRECQHSFQAFGVKPSHEILL
ncbi:hypothetical protein D3C85_1439580 [compost metagenome]